MMTLTDMFKLMGAPLNNPRWSWGAVRPTDGAVFLRVWQDEVRRANDQRLIRVTATSFFAGNESNLGYAERLRHVKLIREGAPSYMIMCVATDIHAAPRAIASFNERDVFVGGHIEETDGDWWLEMTERRPVQSVRM